MNIEDIAAILNICWDSVVKLRNQNKAELKSEVNQGWSLSPVLFHACHVYTAGQWWSTSSWSGPVWKESNNVARREKHLGRKSTALENTGMCLWLMSRFPVDRMPRRGIVKSGNAGNSSHSSKANPTSSLDRPPPLFPIGFKDPWSILHERQDLHDNTYVTPS